LDMTKYPCHDPKLATSQLDRVYAKEMENFDQDYELEQDDERLQVFFGLPQCGLRPSSPADPRRPILRADRRKPGLRWRPSRF